LLPITVISARVGDVISLVHVESVLTNCHVRHENRYGGHEVIALESAKRILEVLRSEAPEGEFNLWVGGAGKGNPDRRGDLDLGNRRWRLVPRSEFSVPGRVPFSVADVLLATKIPEETVRELKYLPRCYMGPDMKYHVGFELFLETERRQRYFQLLGEAGDQMITNQNGPDSDLPPFVDLQPLHRAARK
jgi:hypothetical protein